MYAKARITSKYQITIPKKLRKKLSAGKGDEMVFEEFKDKITISVEKKIDPIEAIDGILEGETVQKIKSRASSMMLRKKLGMV